MQKVVALGPIGSGMSVASAMATLAELGTEVDDCTCWEITKAHPDDMEEPCESKSNTNLNIIRQNLGKATGTKQFGKLGGGFHSSSRKPSRSPLRSARPKSGYGKR